MGFLVDVLNWAPNKIDGSPRSLLSMILDPVGACFEPAELEPFPSMDPAAVTDGEKGSADPDTEELNDDEENAAEAVAKALDSKLAKGDDGTTTVPPPVPEPETAQVTGPVAAPIAAV